MQLAGASRRPVLQLIGAILLGQLGACATGSPNASDTPSQTVSISEPQQESAANPVDAEPDDTDPEETEVAANTPENPLQAMRIGTVTDQQLGEISGIASSRQQSEVIWAINDSGNAPRLFALAPDGQLISSFEANINNRDWEDMALVNWFGQAYLMIADIGDNLGIQDNYSLHFFAEPLLNSATGNALANTVLEPAATLRFRYEDGSHNSEAIAIDADNDSIYLVTKSDNAGVYRIDVEPGSLLAGTSESLAVARLVATLAPVPQSFQETLLGNLAGVNLGHITSMDFSTDNRTAWLMSYRGIFRLRRTESMTWPDAFAGTLEKVHSHTLAQGEAITALTDASAAFGPGQAQVLFTSEKVPAPVWTLSSSLSGQ